MSEPYPAMDPALKEALEALHDFRLYVDTNALSWRRGARLNPMWLRIEELLVRYGMTPTNQYKQDNPRYYLR